MTAGSKGENFLCAISNCYYSSASRQTPWEHWNFCWWNRKTSMGIQL